MKRILVIGSGGAGKSTFAKQLAERTGLLLIHLDALYWRPGWIGSSKEEWTSKIDQLVAVDSWIMDGNYGGTLERRLAACDTVIFLDVSRWVCLWRVIRRRMKYRGKARPDMTAGCHERLTPDYLLWILTYPAQRRPTILRRFSELRPEQKSIVLRTPHAVEDFLRSVVPAGS